MPPDDRNEVVDGILVEAKWTLANPKILFLLKESTRKSGWTHIAGSPVDTRKGDNPRFWPRVLVWKHAVTCASLSQAVPPLPKLSDTKEWKDNNGVLDEIAYVNICKRLGDTISDNRIIRKVAEENRKTLSKQINDIGPDIVFCCYTFKPYCAIYNELGIIREISQGVYVHEQRIVIDFFHPSNRRRDEDLYNQLASILSNQAVIEWFAKKAAIREVTPHALASTK